MPVAPSQYICETEGCGKTFTSSTRSPSRSSRASIPSSAHKVAEITHPISKSPPPDSLAITNYQNAETAATVNITSETSSLPNTQPVWNGTTNQHNATISTGEITLPFVPSITPIPDNTNLPDLVQPFSETGNTLDLSSWLRLGQPSEYLFDEQVYGWVEQILTEQNQTQVQQSPVTFDTYFPVITTPVSQTDISHTAELPIIGEDKVAALQQMWSCISLVNGNTISGSTSITQYFSIGWRIIMARFPIIHVPSFDVTTAPSSFLTAIIALGAVHSVEQVDRDFAKEILPFARAMAVSEPLNDPTARLQTIQGFLISAITGEQLDTIEQHQAQGMVSHAMALMRRFGFLHMTGSGEISANQYDQEAQWRSWAEQESRRRTLWVCWMMDIRSVTLGHHFGSRARSPFRMIIELPCRNDCWLAPNSFAWARRLHISQTIPQALKSTLNKDWSKEWFADTQLAFARLVVIHALAALAWDLAHRDLMLPAEFSSDGPTKIAISLVLGLQSLGKHPSLFDENISAPIKPLTAESYDISTAACLDILVDLTSLEIACGVSAVGIMQNVKTSDRLEANSKLRTWSRTNEATQAAVIAADFLKQSLESVSRWPKSVSHAWTAYLAFLVLWAYETWNSDGHNTLSSDNDANHPEVVSQGSQGQRHAEKAVQYCSQIMNVAGASNYNTPGPRDISSLGLVTIQLMQEVQADIVIQHTQTLSRILEGMRRG
ncbi:uncharacterized protein L201_004558 [Kwoniella dendrophila CBS 6074]|uniref:Xylanolytic transcriptional activator regulatory domain-containing protein n=1 Tax=Kwoniella dendrophila CBS 6074 TaxID=1295534 RepID=A0AAX4JXL0_9TREE